MSPRQTMPKAIADAKRIPIDASSDSLPRRTTTPIRSATPIAKAPPDATGLTPSRTPSATPPNAACATPCPTKDIRRRTTKGESAPQTALTRRPAASARRMRPSARMPVTRVVRGGGSRRGLAGARGAVEVAQLLVGQDLARRAVEPERAVEEADLVHDRADRVDVVRREEDREAQRVPQPHQEV